jgi:hypothetical protein
MTLTPMHHYPTRSESEILSGIECISHHFCTDLTPILRYVEQQTVEKDLDQQIVRIKMVADTWIV